MNIITLSSLNPMHFPLLLHWLNTSHVHQWWNTELIWTEEKIKNKYMTYTQGYKIVNNEKKNIQAYIIEVYDKPIGYIQIYNAYDFPRNPPIQNLPTSLGAFDIFIGNSNYLHKGIGTATINLILHEYTHEYTHILADTNIENIAARKTYTKAGFYIIEIDETFDNVRMLKTK